MDYPYFSSTNFSAYLGIVILTLLCVYDFRKNTIKPDVMLVYWGALLFFIFLNAVVYVGLLAIIAGVKLNFTKLYFYFSGTSAEGFQFESRSLSPILISLLYFGTGSAKFKFNNKEFSIYERMLTLFRNMFPCKTGTEEKIQEYLKNLGDQTDKLTEKVDELHELAEQNDWKIEKQKWKHLEKDARIYNKHVVLLNQIGTELSKRPMDQSTINNIRERITGENEKIKLNLNKKIRKYIFKGLLPNVQNEKALQDVAKFLEVDLYKIVKKPEPQPISRVLALSLIGGIGLSITLQLIKFFQMKSRMLADTAAADLEHVSEAAASLMTPQASLEYTSMFYMTASMFVFLYFFSYISKTRFDANGFFKATILGAAGGFCSNLTFVLMSKGSIILGAQDSLALFADELQRCMWGLVLGMMAAGVGYLFNHFACRKINRIYLRYVGIALAGGVAFWILFLFKFTLEATAMTVYRHAQSFLIGFIVLICVGFVSGILEHEECRRT